MFTEDLAKDWIPLCALADVSAGIVAEARHGGHVFAVFQLGDDFRAAENRCPDCGGALSGGRVEGDTLLCPQTGARLQIPDTASADGSEEFPRTFPLMVVDEQIYLLYRPDED